MEFEVNTSGVCARKIAFSIDDDNKVRNVRFLGGCSGNTQGLSALVEGMDAEDVIKRLKGIDCGGKGTSCPDQLALALTACLEDTN